MARGDDLAEPCLFADRADAGRRLARCLEHLRGEDVVVAGLPRGGVRVALEVARALRAPLEVIVVRKLGVPFQPELAIGAIGEGGARVIDAEVIRGAEVTPRELAKVEARERVELPRRVHLAARKGDAIDATVRASGPAHSPHAMINPE